MSFKFGDMVRNDWTGDINPHRVGMFLYYVTRDSGPFSTTRFAVFARDGKKWEHDSSDEKLVVTGNVFDEIAQLKAKVAELEKQLEDESRKANAREQQVETVYREIGAKEMAEIVCKAIEQNWGMIWSEDGLVQRWKASKQSPLKQNLARGVYDKSQAEVE